MWLVESEQGFFLFFIFEQHFYKSSQRGRQGQGLKMVAGARVVLVETVRIGQTLDIFFR